MYDLLYYYIMHTGHDMKTSEVIIDLDDFLYNIGIECIAKYESDNTFSLVAYNDDSKKILSWLIQTLRDDIPKHMLPIEIKKSRHVGNGLYVYELISTYSNKDYVELLKSLHVIKKLYEKMILRNNMQINI